MLQIGVEYETTAFESSIKSHILVFLFLALDLTAVKLARPRQTHKVVSIHSVKGTNEFIGLSRMCRVPKGGVLSESRLLSRLEEHRYFLF